MAEARKRVSISRNGAQKPWPGKKRVWLAVWVVAVSMGFGVVMFACPGPASELPEYGYRIINTYPHDTGAYTQGLLIHEGRLFEGTGRYGQSTIREVALETGEVLRKRSMDKSVFGEGIAVVGEQVIQLTWKNNVGYVYELETFEPVGEFHYTGEGWGLTYDGSRLIMSNGTSTLRFLDAADYHELGSVQVFDDNGPVLNLNELEYVEGEIFANVWGTEKLARIEPDTGRVTGWIRLDGILNTVGNTGKVDVLNGIAYDQDSKRFFVTGKWWPNLFEIELVLKDS